MAFALPAIGYQVGMGGFLGNDGTKAYAFDDDKPWVTIDERNKKETDFLKMMRIVLDAGYRGYVGIESEGRMNQMEGVKKTKDLLERVRQKLGPEYS